MASPRSAGRARQTGQAMLPILLHPAPGRAERDPVLAREPRQRHAIFERAAAAGSARGPERGLAPRVRQGGWSAILRTPRRSWRPRPRAGWCSAGCSAASGGRGGAPARRRRHPSPGPGGRRRCGAGHGAAAARSDVGRRSARRRASGRSAQQQVDRPWREPTISDSGPGS